MDSFSLSFSLPNSETLKRRIDQKNTYILHEFPRYVTYSLFLFTFHLITPLVQIKSLFNSTKKWHNIGLCSVRPIHSLQIRCACDLNVHEVEVTTAWQSDKKIHEGVCIYRLEPATGLLCWPCKPSHLGMPPLLAKVER